jgi:hypothetical protein
VVLIKKSFSSGQTKNRASDIIWKMGKEIQEKSAFLEMIKRRRKILAEIDRRINAVKIPPLDLRQTK